MSELPNSWRVIPLGDFATVQGGSQPPKKVFIFESKQGYVRLLQIRDFGKKPVPTYVPQNRVTKFCEKDDILIARYGASLGRIVTGMEGAYNVALAKVIADPDVIERRYLFYMLQTQTFQTPLKMISRSAQNGFNTGEIYPICFPIAPLSEQRRIVARIEELFSRLDAGVAALRYAKAQLQRYRQSVLSAAVTGQLTQAWREKADVTLSEWESVSIDDISEVKTGKTPKRGEPQFWTNGTIPWLTSSATSNDFTHEADQFVTKAALDSGLKLFEPGTLLLAMYGEGKTRGQVTEITFQASCNQACAAIIVNDARAFRPFVKLRLQECYEQTRKAASGGNQPNLNLTKVREIPLQLPPLAEQHQIVAEVEARTTAIDRLEAELDRQITRSNRLRQSTLAAAFRNSL